MFDNVRGTETFDDLDISQVGRDTQIDFSGGRITLENTTASLIDDADFVFV